MDQLTEKMLCFLWRSATRTNTAHRWGLVADHLCWADIPGLSPTDSHVLYKVAREHKGDALLRQALQRTANGL